MKATAIAHTNIAFIKYWGRTNEEERLPSNGSLSLNLSELYTTTTVLFDPMLQLDSVTIDGKQDEKETARVGQHLDRIRKLAKNNTFARVVSINTFPSSSGLSSSASGFAALTVAATKALGLELSEKELSILARKGSGSACRSIPSGFVEWQKGESDDTSYALSLFPPDHWDICDVVVVVSSEKKKTATAKAQKEAGTSPFFAQRLAVLPERIEKAKAYIQKKEFSLFGELVEREALGFHALLLTSNPPRIYWLPGTLRVMHEVTRMRDEGIEAYFTINTGHDVHVICRKKDALLVANKLREISSIKNVTINNPSVGTISTEKHLF